MLYFFILSIIQGIGELLPISSSAHTLIVSHFAGYPESTQELEVVLHLGSLLAIICYFYKPLWRMVTDTLKTICTFKSNPGFGGAIMVVAATIPAIAAGYAIKRYAHVSHTLFGIGCAFILFGTLSFLAEYFGKETETKITFSKAMCIGFAQMLAFIPGASRLGVCTTMSRFLGVARWQGVTFAFILAIPALLGAVVLEGYDLIESGQFNTVLELWPTVLMTFGMSLAFLPLLKWYLQKCSFVPFALYRVGFGAFLIYEAYKLGMDMSITGFLFNGQ